MDMILSILGVILAFGAALTVARTGTIWQGMFKDELFMITGGFILLGFGFMMKALAAMQLTPQFDVALFTLGMVLLFFGSSRIFTFTYGGK